MKTKGLIKLLVGLTLAASGAFTVGSGLSQKRSEVVDGLNSGSTIYINMPSNLGTAYVYEYNSDSDKKADWPGTAAAHTGFVNEEGKNIYSYVLGNYTYFIIAFYPDGWNGSTGQSNTTYTRSSVSQNGIWIGDQVPNTSKFYDGSYSYSAPSAKVYFYDKDNQLNAGTYHAHVYGDGAYGTSWPGIVMTKVAGTNRMYEATVHSGFTHAIINNGYSGNNNQTPEIATTAGKVVVLNSGWTMQSVSLEAAQFVDTKMHFNDIPTSNTGTTANCASNYSTAKSAYNALSSNSVRKEALSIDGVSERLSWWAIANGSTLDTSGGGVLAANTISFSPINEKTNTIAIIVIISLVSVTAIGGFFFIKKRKEN